MNWSKLKIIYFLGIGGIGMSALARYFNQMGKNVSGYDRTPTVLTSKLIEEGIKIHFEDDITQIPESVDLIIYTPAIPIEMGEYQYLLRSNIPILKRAALLGKIASEENTIAVAGTHGKTTVSTMIAHLLSFSKIGCKAFLGGISKNYTSNFIDDNDARFLVAEADEYDQSFLSLHPMMAVVTSADADHLDVYGKKEMLLDSFQQFIDQICTGGKLIIKKSLKLKAKSDIDTYSYALNEPADFYATSIKLINGNINFSLVTPERIIEDLTLGIPGLINLENAVAAMAIAYLSGVQEDDLRDGIKGFLGINRRFDVRFKSDNHIYIDDYAHHPIEIHAFLSSVKGMYPGKKILGIFQPHLFSRTRDFASEFAVSLELLDEVILLPIYPAREKPIEGVNSEMISDMINLEHKASLNKNDIVDILREKDFDILVTMGAGDIDQLVGPICKRLEENFKNIPS